LSVVLQVVEPDPPMTMSARYATALRLDAFDGDDGTTPYVRFA
jgi:hypothetical protein